MRFFRALATTAAVTIWALTGWAGGGFAGPVSTKGLVPMPYNVNPATDLSVEVSNRQPRIGDTVQVCFQASQNGYVTLWDVGTSGRVARIFPNQHDGSNAAATEVTGGQRYCAGKDADPFTFEVSGPTGLDELYIVWTVKSDLQPAGADYKDAAALGAAFEDLKQKAPQSWASFKTSFNVIGPDGPTPPTLPPLQNGGAVPPSPDHAPSSPPPPAAIPAPGSGEHQASGSTNSPVITASQTTTAPSPTPVAQTPVGTANGKVYILAVGSNVAPLTKANQDADLFVSQFERLFAVPKANIRVYHDVLRAQFQQGMDWLRQTAGPDDLVIIYYSGHGTQIDDDDGDEADGLDEAFVPYDVEGKAKPVPADFIRDDDFARWVNALRTDHVLNVFDACHSGGLNRGLGDVVTGGNPKFYYNPDLVARARARKSLEASTPKLMPKGTTLAAAAETQAAIEDAGGSLFTLALVDAASAQRQGTMVDIFANAAKAVDAETQGRQSPTVVGPPTTAERITLKP